MNIPKIILPLFILSIVVLILFSYTLPNKFEVTKSIIIKTRPYHLFKYISKLNNWEDFNPISSKDNNTKYTYFYNKDSIEYAVNWYSEVEGKGRVEIKTLNNNLLSYNFDMYELNQKAIGIFRIDSLGENSKLTWKFKGELENNPVAKLLGYFSDNVFGYDMKKSLIKIKHKVESK